MSAHGEDELKELDELRRKIQEDPARKNQLLFEWVYSRPDDFAFRFQWFTIATARGEMSVNITNSTVGGINFGEQIGHIESTVNAIASKSDEKDAKFAEAILALTEAIKVAPKIGEAEKKDAVDVLAAIADEANSDPAKRSPGKVKAFLMSFPTLIAAAADLTALWATYGPAVRGYFGL